MYILYEVEIFEDFLKLKSLVCLTSRSFFF